MNQYTFEYYLRFKDRRWTRNELILRAETQAKAVETAKEMIARNYTRVNPAFQYRDLRLINQK